MRDLDRYFYTVELDSNNQKVIHLLANLEVNNTNEFDKKYCLNEWSGMYLSIEDFKHKSRSAEAAMDIFEEIKYTKDLTEDEAKEILETYFDGKPGTRLRFGKLNQDTPCGCYWC